MNEVRSSQNVVKRPQPTSSSRIPIVFVHRGASWYLPYALYQARRWAGGGTVLLLGTGKRAWTGVGQREWDEVHPALQRFRNVYAHYSTNPYEFELTCWLRWFALLKLMKEEGWNDCLYLDSDVLLYASPDELIHQSCGKGEGAAYFAPEQNGGGYDWSASGHVSYWTMPALEAFCDFAAWSFSDPVKRAGYEAKWQWHLARGVPGGVCDMTGLYHFREAFPGLIGNLAVPGMLGVVDRAMGTSDNRIPREFQMRRGVKAVAFESGSPMLTTTTTGERMRVAALHFQGWTKDLIPFYYRGGHFCGKWCSDAAAVWRFGRQRIAWRVRRMFPKAKVRQGACERTKVC